jgi:hypothetical protein
MHSRDKKLLLVGDNPFHGISHLSQERARARGGEINLADYAAKLILTSLDNGANGFMFSVSETTLQILKTVSEKTKENPPALYAIVPYAYEYVRIATHLGTVGLAKKLGWQIIRSRSPSAIFAGLKSILTINPEDLMKTYLYYELSRIKSSAGRQQKLKSIMLHEIITDIILALDLDQLTHSYIAFLLKHGIEPGFETRNFPYLVYKFKKWDVDFSKLTITSSFNKAGFQMNPSRKECEIALTQVPECHNIAMSILAAGYLTPPEAAEYIKSLPNIKGVVVGVSKEKHALETFKNLKQKLQ